MTIETLAEIDLTYFLVSYDNRGNERSDDPDSPDGFLSSVILDAMSHGSFSDVFLISHGWKGDIPAARDQYERWLHAMNHCESDIETLRRIRDNFEPLIIGLHWPSLPWGEEDHSPAEPYSVYGGGVQEMIDDAADKIASTPRALGALEVIFDSVLEDPDPAFLPSEVVAAYQILWEEAGLTAEGPGGAPGEDLAPFDPEGLYQDARDSAVTFSGGLVAGLLSPLRQLSFWKMKKRARTFGESGAGTLLRKLQGAVPDGRNVRFHLMGHSFGCIAVCACVSGAGGASLQRPVDSIYLVQGALSLWSFCSEIPVAIGKKGYFNDIFSLNKVRGPVLTTQSEHDTAVGKLYPLAAGAARQVDMAPDDAPKYGALGAFGARGPGIDIVDLPLGSTHSQYDFEEGRVYNLEASEYIMEGGGLSGAHNDIARPEVAHAFWQAIII